MNNIYGPYERSEWNVMLTLRNNLKHYANDNELTANPVKQSLLKKERNLYQMFKNKEVA